MDNFIDNAGIHIIFYIGQSTQTEMSVYTINTKQNITNNIYCKIICLKIFSVVKIYTVHISRLLGGRGFSQNDEVFGNQTSTE